MDDWFDISHSKDKENQDNGIGSSKQTLKWEEDNDWGNWQNWTTSVDKQEETVHSSKDSVVSTQINAASIVSVTTTTSTAKSTSTSTATVQAIGAAGKTLSWEEDNDWGTWQNWTTSVDKQEETVHSSKDAIISTQMNAASIVSVTTTTSTAKATSTSTDTVQAIGAAGKTQSYDPWEHEDAGKFLAMSRSEKRKIYAKQPYTTLEEIMIFSPTKIRHIHSPSRAHFITNREINRKISLWRGDITRLEIDCIVNASNEKLVNGGGVNGAIQKSAGPSLAKELSLFDGCPPGNAILTGGHLLPSKYIIHTVGPKGNDANVLQMAYFNVLNLARRKNIKQIAFPCISTGIF
uniref:Macro domain-containing protein n=1 Tax=Clytia hemisphaerica TaxID=252671 RepID=A0A7M5XJK5_9CNID